MLHESKLMRIETLETYLTLSWSENAEMNEYSDFQIGPDSAAECWQALPNDPSYTKTSVTKPDKPSEIED